MTPDKPKPSNVKTSPAGAKPGGAAFPAVTMPKPPPMFRAADWICFGITSLLMFLSYMYTLAPDLTLQDSGELAVASQYAGVPHPPGYPIWTIYTWLFTVLLPISNMAYRVAVSSAVAGALTCGLVAIMVSRGSSMLMEGISEFKDIAKRWENEICVVTGLVSGTLIGFDGFMWSQAVIVEVYTWTALSLVGVMVLLMRWVYAPHQHRYLYLAWFVFGIAFNNHQSVLVCALAMEVMMLVVQPKLGRDLLLGNTIIWILGLIGAQMGLISTLKENPPVMYIFCLIGVVSAVGFLWLWIQTRQVLTAMHWGLICFVAFVLGVAFYLFMPITSMANPPMNWGYPRTVAGFFHAFTRGQYERIHPTTGTGSGLQLIYTFCERLAGQYRMLAEGTLEEINPLFLLIIPLAVLALLALRRSKNLEVTWLRSGTLAALAWLVISFVFLIFRDMDAESLLRDWVSERMVSAVLVLATLVVMVGVGCALWALVSLFRCLQLRERAWLIGLGVLWIVMGPFLIMLFNPQPDRQSLSLIKVFFTPSHTFVAMALGYALTILLATLATAYEAVRRQAILTSAVLVGFALFAVVTTYSRTQYYLPRTAALLVLGLTLAVLLIQIMARTRAPLGPLLVVVALLPAWPVCSHWSENEQRGHLFGFWFGHDMFTPPFKGADGKPLYPLMDKDTILFGGTDPGRFCPTYMIFCDSFTPPEKRRDKDFDRRDVYIITQNALADGTYLNYIRAHYFRSAQIDPPFFSEFVRSERERSLNYKTNLLAQMLLPVDRFFLGLGDRIEKKRRAGSSFFRESDLLSVGDLAKSLKLGSTPSALSKYIYSNLSPHTQELVKTLVDEALPAALVKDLNRLIDSEYELNRSLPGMREELARLTEELAVLKARGKADSRQARGKQQRVAELEKQITEAAKIVPLYDPERFKDVPLSDYVKQFAAQNPQLHSRIRLSRLLLEEAYPKVFKRSQGGLYPDREIYTPSNEDSQKCFNEYMVDAQERMKKGQLKPGEDVRVIDNKVQVSGQVAVMAINGLLTKVIFDHNPDNEFYVEESFPLDWMFPHLTPYGIIMKINRKPVPEMTEDMVRRDHEFWCQYSDRLIGNWISYDTSISNICAFAEKTYVNHDYRGFKGDPRFVRDDDAQKAFSKLRSSIGGVYAWRIDNARSEPERLRCLKEAEFAFKQAYAYCPYSPEALYRFVNILLRGGRVDDARLMAITSKKLDPANSGLDRLIEELERIKKQQQTAVQNTSQVAPMEAEFRARPNNVTNALQLAQTLAQLGQTERVRQIADVLLTNSTGDASAVYFTVQVYSQLRDTLKLETALQNWVRVSPTPEAWMDLAAIKTLLNKTPEALASLKTCLELNARRLAANPAASNLALLARTDERLRPLQGRPEFQQLLATNL
jgi:tetratricopeptide (TPR) repeat protein